jgi:hypothetical protein
MCQGLGVGEIVDPDNLNIRPPDLNGTKEIAANSAKAINSNLHRILSPQLNPLPIPKHDPGSTNQS